MSNTAVHSQLKIAEDFAQHTHNYLRAALHLAVPTDCPKSHIQAIEKACRDAHALWLHVGNVAPLFHQPAEPPPE